MSSTKLNLSSVLGSPVRRSVVTPRTSQFEHKNTSQAVDRVFAGSKEQHLDGENQLNLSSPSVHLCKKQRSSLGAALRVKTPCKAIDDSCKENAGLQLLNPSVNSEDTSKDLEDNIITLENCSATVTKKNWHLEDFLVGKPLGKGKFGNVYLARLKSSLPVELQTKKRSYETLVEEKSELPDQFALKMVFKAQLKAAGSGTQSLLHEVTVLQILQHEHITRLFG